MMRLKLGPNRNILVKRHGKTTTINIFTNLIFNFIDRRTCTRNVTWKLEVTATEVAILRSQLIHM